MAPAGSGRPFGADMSAHQLRRDEHRRPALDRLALLRSVAVARPHPLSPAQHLVVDPGSARRATLDLDTGMPLAQLVQEPVQRQCLLVGARRPSGAAGAYVVAVHVPLQVCDVVIAQQGVELAQNVIERALLGEVEHELMPGQHRLVSVGGERPLGMSPKEVAVGADHLRLDPDAELHAESRDMLDQRPEAPGVDVGRHHPVAQTRRFGAPRPEPAVVEHPPLRPDPCRPVGQSPEPVEVVIEIYGLPGVEQHRPRGTAGGSAGLAGDGGTAAWPRSVRLRCAPPPPRDCGTTLPARG